jgi:hypothetical protein
MRALVQLAAGFVGIQIPAGGFPATRGEYRAHVSPDSRGLDADHVGLFTMMVLAAALVTVLGLIGQLQIASYEPVTSIQDDSLGRVLEGDRVEHLRRCRNLIEVLESPEPRSRPLRAVHIPSGSGSLPMRVPAVSHDGLLLRRVVRDSTRTGSSGA